MDKKRKKGSGGTRPGSGPKKMSPEKKKVIVSIYVPKGIRDGLSYSECRMIGQIAILKAHAELKG